MTVSQDDQGLRIDRLQGSSIFAEAGIRSSDVILSVDGRNVSSRDSLLQSFRRGRPGQPIAVVVLRDGRRRTYQVSWDQPQAWESYRPDTSDWSDQGALGVLLDSRYGDAAVVVNVYDNSPAQEAGLRRGDQILTVNGQEVFSPRHLSSIVASLDPGTEVTIEYARRLRQSAEVRLESREILRETDDRPRVSRDGGQDDRFDGGGSRSNARVNQDDRDRNDTFDDRNRGSDDRSDRNRD